MIELNMLWVILFGCGSGFFIAFLLINLVFEKWSHEQTRGRAKRELAREERRGKLSELNNKFVAAELLKSNPEPKHGTLLSRANMQVVESNTNRIEDVERWISKQERIKQFELNEKEVLKK